MRMASGLVSVTFRKLSAERVIALSREAGLEGIEWGGDVHVPVGDLARAREVGARTAEAGLKVFSYGSYYVAGEATGTFEKVLDTAIALGVSNIRIWAGRKGSAACGEAERRGILTDIARVATLAYSARIAISLERHGDTLTDCASSTLSLLQQLRHPNLFTYWQPAVDLSHEGALRELEMLLPWVSAVHVFEWVRGGTERLALEEGRKAWGRYLGAVARGRREMPALLEFVKGDSEEQFLADAKVLRGLLAAAEKKDSRGEGGGDSPFKRLVG